MKNRRLRGKNVRSLRKQQLASKEEKMIRMLPCLSKVENPWVSKKVVIRKRITLPL